MSEPFAAQAPAGLMSRLSEYQVMFGLLGILGLMILPLPPLALDMLLAVNITLSILVMLTSLYVRKPLDFSIFPALLLITTLFRLGLNVASTRLILVGASQGKAEAGSIITTFGQFVVGGQVIVGLILFVILVLINFMVITKGAGRIAEVSARFTLDSLPGKQMSIDAELAAGSLNDEAARKKREELARETDFYGAMDGASKFVRGDAIAGLLITAINILGGLILATVQGGMPLELATREFTILTVGDGLVSQIPALLISTAAGLLVTRSGSEQALHEQLGQQLMGQQRVLFGAAMALTGLGFVPGMPGVVFWPLAAACVWAGLRVQRVQEAQAQESARQERERQGTGAHATTPEVAMQDTLQTEILTLELGLGLLTMADEAVGGDLSSRLVGLRRVFAAELGVMLPAVHLRDNLTQPSHEYKLSLKGQLIARGELFPTELLALVNAEGAPKLPGRPTRDPTFGLDAYWIQPQDRYRAEACGYTVVEPAAVLMTHMTEALRQHAEELISWEDLQARLELIRQQSPRLVEDLIPGVMSFAQVLKIMRGLVRERVPVRDLRTILEVLVELGPAERAHGALLDHVRARMARTISAQLCAADGSLYAAVLDRTMEDRLRSCLVVQHQEPLLACDLASAQALFGELEAVLPEFNARQVEPVLLAPPDLRGPLRQFITQFFPHIHVLSHREVAAQTQLVSVGQLRLTA